MIRLRNKGVEMGLVGTTIQWFAVACVAVGCSSNSSERCESNVLSKRKVIETGTGNEVAMAMNSDARIIACGSGANIKLFKRTDPKNITLLKGHTAYINCLAFSTSGRFLVSGSGDCTGRLWNLDSNSLIYALKGHQDIVDSVAISPDEQLIATGSWDKTVRVWDRDSGKSIGILKGHKAAVNSVDFSPDGKYLATGSADKSIKIWRVNGMKEVRTIRGYKDEVHVVRFNQMSGELLSAGVDRTIYCSNTKTGKIVWALRSGHGNTIVALAATRDGKIMITGGIDKMIKIWDLASKKEICSQHMLSFVESIAISDKQRFVAVMTFVDGSITIWKLWKSKPAN